MLWGGGVVGGCGGHERGPQLPADDHGFGVGVTAEHDRFRVRPVRAQSGQDARKAFGGLAESQNLVGVERIAGVVATGEEAGHGSGGLAVGVGEERGVDVQGGGCLGVPEAARHGAQVDVGAEEPGGDVVAQIVEA